MKTRLSLAVLAAATATLSAAQPSLTIYNSGLGVIRETLPLDLKSGESSVSFDRATAQVLPDSVVLRDPAGKNAFSILEQGYRNDPVSQGLLLSHFEGQTIDFRMVYPDGKVEEKPGKIIRSGYVPGGQAQDPIIEMDGKLRFELPGKPVFPALGDDSILRPTLSWALHSEAPAKFDAELSYLSRGFSWEATYNAVAAEGGDTLALTGWITVNNRSGTAFREAQVKLVAGDVNVVKDPEMVTRFSRMNEERLGVGIGPGRGVEEKAFDDFHLYTLGRPLTIRDQETKQVEFLRAPAVKAVKKYIYDGTRSGKPKQVASYWEFRNDEASGLGMPLPAGKVRFYRADGTDGNLEFVGENKIDHTPKDEKLSLLTGYAFDLAAERKVLDTDYRERQKWSDTTVEITLRNHSKAAKEIVVKEHPSQGENWKLTKNSDPFEKTEASEFEFKVSVVPDEEKKVTYTIHESW